MKNAYHLICRNFLAPDLGSRRRIVSQFEETDRQFKQAPRPLTAPAAHDV
jgi:hypothetical protein